MSLSWADNFSQYPLGQLPPGVWSGRALPTVATQGRNGGQRVSWNANAMVRGAGGGTTFFRAAMRIDSGGGVKTWRTSGDPVELPNTLTSWHWICGGSWNGYAYSGLVVTDDGAIHAVRGGAFESGPNSQLVFVLGSSQSAVVPIRRGWFLLEAMFVWSETGSIQVRINGVPVLGVFGANTKSPEDYCSVVRKQPACPIESPFLWPNFVSEFGMGGFTRGASAIAPTGWTGSVDFLAAFDQDPGDIADMEVTDLLPDGDGVISQSVIAGTSPAPTRWQSVDDALSPDGTVTTVVFSNATPREDEYTLSPFPYTAPTIYGVQVSANHRVSSPGYASADLGVSDGTNVRYAPPLFSRARSFRVHSGATPERPAGGAWSVADLANLRVRVRRGA